jgi:hypothetical protein
VALAVVMSMALVSGLIVANWTGESNPRTTLTPMPPTPAAIDACNQWAADQTGPQTRPSAAANNGATGTALVGLDENRKHDERYRAAYATCLRARGYAV